MTPPPFRIAASTTRSGQGASPDAADEAAKKLR